jgi:hypothetical protein
MPLVSFASFVCLVFKDGACGACALAGLRIAALDSESPAVMMGARGPSRPRGSLTLLDVEKLKADLGDFTGEAT